MSWHFSRALVAEYSVANSSDGEPSAPLNGNHTPQAYLSPVRMTAFSRLSRYGMTCEPLTEKLGEELLTWFLAGFHARTYPAQEKAQESTESAAECGRTWPESLAKYDHDSRLWKTPQCSLLEGLDVYSETWPRWGMMRNGECLALDISGRGIFVKESGWWLPTIGKNEYRGTSRERFRGSKEFRGAKMCEGLRTCADDPTYLTPNFAEYAMGWPVTWTELAPLETDKYRQWLLSHGKS